MRKKWHRRTMKYKRKQKKKNQVNKCEGGTCVTPLSLENRCFHMS